MVQAAAGHTVWGASYTQSVLECPQKGRAWRLGCVCSCVTFTVVVSRASSKIAILKSQCGQSRPMKCLLPERCTFSGLKRLCPSKNSFTRYQVKLGWPYLWPFLWPEQSKAFFEGIFVCVIIGIAIKPNATCSTTILNTSRKLWQELVEVSFCDSNKALMCRMRTSVGKKRERKMVKRKELFNHEWTPAQRSQP